MVQAANSRQGDNHTSHGDTLDRAAARRLVAQGHVWTIGVVVGGVPADQPQHVALSQDNHVVQELAP
jgi:hypothetical protein